MTFQKDYQASRSHVGGRLIRLLAEEQRERAAGIAEVLRGELAALEPEDRLLLRQYFVEGLTVASIARALQRKQRRLYTRIEKILRRLRRALEARELRKGQVVDALQADTAEPAPEGAPLEGLLAAALDDSSVGFGRSGVSEV